MKTLGMTRRKFLAISATSAAAAAVWSADRQRVFADGPAPVAGGETHRIRSCCRGCGKMECGVWVTVKDGRAIKIEGDTSAFQSKGNCCTKSMASLQAAYHPDRLKYPMKRTRPKGEDPGWVRVSWDEALTTSAAAFKSIMAKYGGESIFTMCGTSRIWCMAPYFAFRQLFETPNVVAPWQVCKGPRGFSGELTDEFAFFWMATVDHPKVYVQWGASPEISNYDDSGRMVVDVSKKAKHYINVNPRVSNLGKEADIWLPLRPGTDNAMALSWMDVIIRNKLYDELYCKRWTNGPFLYCADIEPSGFSAPNNFGGTFELKTKLLKESDIKAGGDPHKFMVWDKLHNRLTYFNSSTNLWEGETFKVPTKGVRILEDGCPSDAFLPEPSQFNPAKDPALFGEYEVKLKNGKTAKVTPVFQLLANRAAEYTPVKAEEITGVPAEKIELAAKTYATRINPDYGNGGIHYELAVEHTSHAVQNCRALAVLVGITGNFDGPAGNRGRTSASVPISDCPGSMSFANPLPSPETFNKKLLGGDRFPLLTWWKNWADATSVWDAANTGKPYPVKGAIQMSGDFMNMSNPQETWEALKKLEFYLAIDLWHHPTTENADIILPAAHWLELDCTRVSQGSAGAAGMTCKCIEPLAECKPDVQITQLLFKAMGKPFAPGPNPWPMEDIFNFELGFVENGKKMSWQRYKEKFQQEGWYDIKKLYPEGWGTYRRYETGMLRTMTFKGGPGKPAIVPGFSTPTGMHEIWCTTIESYHPGQGFELPRYDEPYESPIRRPDLHAKYPLTAITGRRIPVYFHSEHRQLPWCREQWPVPLVEINPETAAKYGIKHGDWVWIENDRGRLRQKADLYYGIAPDVIQCEHQWWFPEQPAPEHGWRYSAINQLVDSHAQCELSGAVNLRAYAVKIYKATEGAPEGIILSGSDERLKRWLPVHEGRA